jgi:DNA helicase-2/ATP-dependent DNA helicase PcrA
MMDDPFDLTDEFEPRAPESGGVPPWLQGLNPEQAEAVNTTEGPLLVLSGAGTGKTRVLTTRLANILAQRLAPPWNCLCVTFTNRAAKEMRERVGQMIGPLADQVWLGTFHALGVRMLRKHGDLVGLRNGFTILDSDDQNRLLKPLMEERAIDTKKWPVNVVMGIIQRWKDRGWRPEVVPKSEIGDAAGGHVLDLYSAYQARLLAVNACDFGDLLLHCLTLFREQPEVLQGYQRQFRYILVDEYQDTNVAQYMWLRALSAGYKNICCVGDDDQSIYSWRGAEVANILRFDQDFPGARVVRLERNYRSTPAILGAASGLIRHNSGRLGKDLRAASAEQRGEKVTVYGVWDGEAEARWVVDRIEDLSRDRMPLSQMAILVRAGFQTREFEERLIITGTPYRVVGGLRFYERAEIRDAVAYLRLVEQPADDLAFERVINTPKRGLGDASIQVVHRAARAMGVPLLQAARAVLDTDELKPRARKAMAAFVLAIDEWAAIRDGLGPGELMGQILEESGYIAMWRADKSPEAPGRVENLQELVSALEEFTSVGEFLEHISLVMENDAKAGEGDAVTVMTLHAAKGLEFDAVFLPGWEEEVFPNRRALDQNGVSALEEERRLAYVGITRARKRAFISHAANRRVFNQWQNNMPSRFIEEIPDDFRETDGDAGLMAGSMGRSESWSSWGGSWDQPSGRSGGDSGWNRRKAQFQDQEGLSWKVSRRESSSGPNYQRGDRVFHDKFGYGDVVITDGDKLEVMFDKAGRKKVVSSFVTPVED